MVFPNFFIDNAVPREPHREVGMNVRHPVPAATTSRLLGQSRSPPWSSAALVETAADRRRHPAGAREWLRIA